MDDCHKKKKKMKDTGQNVDLPPEIIHNILPRLPVKTLCRFKLVSKPWQSLITDPRFVANYSKSIENKDVFFRRRRLLLNIYCSRSRYHSFSLDLDQFLNENRNVNVDGLVAAPTRLDFVCDSTVVHSSCYGLFLAKKASRNSFFSFLQNPVTKESKKLPKAPILWRPETPWCHLYGLGYDYSTNEYKVINGQYYDNYYREGLVFNVYTLQTDCWRQIDFLFPYRVDGPTTGIMVNGAVHWLLEKIADGSLVIISFLLADEEVRELPLPLNVSLVGGETQLGAFRNWPCITSPSMINAFWVMKEHGVRESWTKMQVSKQYSTLQHSGFWTESHDLMVFDHSSLVMYNFNDGTSWTLSIGKVGFISSIGIYVETLPSFYSLIKNNKNNIFGGR